MEINEVTDKPCPAEIIAIAINDCVHEQHCGIVYTTGTGKIKLCDFKWEDFLAVRNVPDDFVWVKVKLEEYEVAQLAEFVEFVIGKHHRSLPAPYSFVYGPDAFDITGSLRPGVGLTCATFVIGIFDHLKLHVVDLTSWRPRPTQDTRFRERIIRIAENNRFSAVAARLRTENPNFRIKPWELFSSATHARYPVKYRQAAKLTKTMSKLLRRKRPNPKTCTGCH